MSCAALSMSSCALGSVAAAPGGAGGRADIFLGEDFVSGAEKKFMEVLGAIENTLEI